MPRLRIFRSSSRNEWLSLILVVAQGLVTISNAVPFPYVNAALVSGSALLELIQMVDKSNDDLRCLAESVLTIMRLLREETGFHPSDQNRKFRDFWRAFERDLTKLAKDLESIRKRQRASRFKKYFNARKTRDDIGHSTRQIDDLRANATVRLADLWLFEFRSSLVFHGEFCTIDEYTNRLPSPSAIVDWD
ncbi:hypothetical protein C8R47DRAFT_106025 [Mycena vitilis]|nr:hypothetical protein C8R47DRAFT_106025 [Mycena vitilis]